MRTIPTLAALAVAAAAVPSVAHATEITRDGDAYVMRGQPGEANVLGVRVDSFNAGNLDLSDRTSNPMTADPALGCTIIRTRFGSTATCPVTAAGIKTARLEGGDGADELDINPFGLPLTEPVTLDGGAGDDDVEGPTEALAVILRGGDGNDTVRGGKGNDLTDGGPGNDRVDGGDGNDTVLGGAGDDVISGGRTFSSDVIDGGPGYDKVMSDWTDSTRISVTFDGVANDGSEGENDNVLSVDAIETTRIAFLQAADEAVDFSVTNTPAGSSTLLGSPQNDRLRSGQYDDRIEGGGGADAIAAGGGNDTIVGGPGPDVILADGGVICDFISCSENLQGNDTIDARDGEKDIIDCGPGTDTALVDAIDVLAGCEIVNGSGPITPPPPGGKDSPPPPPAAARCVVPKVRRGATLLAVRTALAKGKCRVEVRRTRSTVKKGRVVALRRRAGKRLLTVKAGTKLATTTRIVITVSSGRR